MIARQRWIFWSVIAGVLLPVSGGVLSLCLVTGCTWKLKTRTPGLTEQQHAPDFSLPDAHGEPVTLDSLLANGPAVVVFYRGAW